MTALHVRRPRQRQVLRPIMPGLLWHSGCHCPGCGQRQWHVGRVTAECAACETALIIANDSEPQGGSPWPNA